MLRTMARMMLKAGNIHHIRYTKPSTGEVTERYIVPSFVPPANVKAIDVTDMESSERDDLCELLVKYTDYVKEKSKSIFSFEDYVSHQTNQIITPKWRTFKNSGLKQLD